MRSASLSSGAALFTDRHLLSRSGRRLAATPCYWAQPASGLSLDVATLGRLTGSGATSCASARRPLAPTPGARRRPLLGSGLELYKRRPDTGQRRCSRTRRQRRHHHWPQPPHPCGWRGVGRRYPAGGIARHSWRDRQQQQRGGFGQPGRREQRCRHPGRTQQWGHRLREYRCRTDGASGKRRLGGHRRPGPNGHRGGRRSRHRRQR